MALTLLEWLARIERAHPSAIAMGLERVARVRDAMGATFSGPVVIVGGTNGKGSTCAMLEAILRAAGYRVGLYTSPHLLRYNERVRIDGEEASDEALVQGFERAEAARGETPLTYFEYGTLAAWQLFAEAGLDVLILEVGLGGRLDAVNAFEPDCSVVTSIGIDHVDYLGPTRESIGFEKAGIFRAGRPAICGDPNPPATLVEHARAIGAELKVIGRDFGFEGVFEGNQRQWNYRGRQGARLALAPPALRGDLQLVNASTALAALDALASRLPVSMQAVREGLARVELPGRFQVMPGRPVVVLDVAHNPQAAKVLAGNLGDMGFHPDTYAVLGMLKDKDIEGVVRELAGRVTHWLVATLTGARAARADELAQAIARAGAPGEVMAFDSPRFAYEEALRRAGENDRIVVFGSFVTVAEVMAIRAGA